MTQYVVRLIGCINGTLGEYYLARTLSRLTEDITEATIYDGDYPDVPYQMGLDYLFLTNQYNEDIEVHVEELA